MYQEYKAAGQELIDATGEAKDMVQELGGHLKSFFGAHEKLEHHLEEQAVKASKVREPELSVNQEAFDRIMAQKQMWRLETELREMMVYQAPPELGAIWSEFEAMRDRVRAERAEAKRQEQYRAQVTLWRRKRAVEEIKAKAVWIGAVLLVVVWMIYLLVLIRSSTTFRYQFLSPWWSCVLC
jgi:hypothetical protein